MPRNQKKSYRKPSSVPKKPPLTHFLCIPLVNSTSKSQLEASLASLKQDVCQEQLAESNVPPASTNRPDSPLKLEDKTVAISSSPEQRSNQRNPTSVAEKAVRPAGVLHLTLGVMSLDEQTLAAAISLLQNLNIGSLLQSAKPLNDHVSVASLSPNDNLEGSATNLGKIPDTLTRSISPPPISRNTECVSEPLKIELKGLVSMHPPHKTSILYTAPTDPSSRLYPLCEELRAIFQKAGFLLEDIRPLKLHATIVNTIYAKGNKLGSAGRGKRKQLQERSKSTDPTQEKDDRSQGHGPNAKAPLRIDARDILERYQDFIWAQNVVLDRIAICEMGAKKVVDQSGKVVNEQYKEVAHIALPGTR